MSSFTSSLDGSIITKIAEELASTILTDENLCSHTDDPQKNREAIFDNCAYVRVAAEHSWSLYLQASIYPEAISEMVDTIKRDVARVKEAAGIDAAE